MKQPDTLDVGTQMDVVRHRLAVAKEGVAFKRHKDTLSYFNKNYIHKEIFPRELGRKIVKAEEIRHANDYDTFYIASKEITAQQIQTAEQILRLTEKYLEEDTKYISFFKIAFSQYTAESQGNSFSFPNDSEME